jgi:hypothetical protein
VERLKAMTREPMPFVGRLFAELGEPSSVAARLQSDASLTDALRRAAFQEVMRRGGK